MRILKIISALLGYPSQEMQEALGEMAWAVEGEESLPVRDRTALLNWLKNLQGMDLIDWQQDYMDLFDRGRNLSLHLFEHVHGESRDRGQAMVDLLEIYRRRGFEIASRELPDYLPLFLEFLSQAPKDEAFDLLSGARPILELLRDRLATRSSRYATLLTALVHLTGEQESAPVQAGAEEPDEALLRMDEIWEEEAVSFLGNPKACTASATESILVKFTPRREAPAAGALQPKGTP